MGVVYEALDKVRNERVALKTLHRLDPQLLYVLKSEFRVVQNLYHPNLIRLGELFEDKGNWFFTMELVQGKQLLSYVRSSDTPLPNDGGGQATVDLATLDTGQSDTNLPTANYECNFERLRKALEGVISGLHALHRVGLVHCDVKPGNIMITESGRVVVLDFGLAHEPGDGSHTVSVVGTPAYLAPEQAAGLAASPASDWYALGVTLYEALTGRLPYQGKNNEVMANKQREDPPTPSSLDIVVPADLEALCMDLLTRDPIERPSGHSLLQKVSQAAVVAAVGRVPAHGKDCFVGRHRELAMLESAFASVKPAKPVVVHVQGASGLGKTALVEHFLVGAQARPDTVVLRGRCLQRASVPFKGLDHLIDSLSIYLKSLRRSELAALVPEGTVELLDVFPVLRQLYSFTSQRDRSDASTDPRERRSRAFSALRELLRALSQRKRLILFIDDLQWSDVDSTLLLSTLLRGTQAPGLLLIDAFRSEQLEDPRLLELSDVGSREGSRRLVLQPLSDSETIDLAHLLLAARAPGGEREFVAKVATEVSGSPLLLTELARHLKESELLGSSLNISLGEVISRRLMDLPETALLLLQTVALLPRPVEPELAFMAAGLEQDGQSAMQILTSTYMVLLVEGEPATVELFHESLREYVLREISEKRVEVLRGQIAKAIALGHWSDAKLLALDWALVHGSESTFARIVEAAQEAKQGLAFERSANLYRQALALCAFEDATALRREYADSLCLAGQGAEAAAEYLALAETADPLLRVDLIRLAADNFLWTGHIKEGLFHLDSVMQELGVRLPATRNRAIVELLSKRLQLSLKRRNYKLRVMSEDSSPQREELVKLDSLYSASTSLGMIDHLRGSLLQSQCLLWALRVGDESRICRALAAEMGYLAVQGSKGVAMAESIGRDILLRAERIGDNRLLGVVHIGIGLTQFFSGCFTRARLTMEEGLVYLKRESSAWWEVNTAEFFYCLAQLNEGDFLSYAPSVEISLNRAKRRNDAYTDYLFSGHPSIWCAMRDDNVGPAQEKLVTILERWPEGVNYQAHYSVMAGKVMALLYMGQAEEAASCMDASKGLLQDLMIHRMPFIQGEANKLRGRAAVLLGDHKTARSMAGALRKSDIGIARAMGALLLAPLALQAGEIESAQRLLAEALELSLTSGAQHIAKACKYRQGELLGGEIGDEMSHSSYEWMRGHGVVCPERMFDFLTPGFSQP